MQSVPSNILELVERFSRDQIRYKSEGYNEAQLRREFLEPFFEELGWDLANRSGFADAYKDVIHEDSIKVGSATKAPDYCFRIGGTRKFFLEAKRPSVDIFKDISSAYQLKRYAWSAKLPISVLSDFEEFAIYDTRVKPVATDKASVARIFYCTYDQFPEKWNDIASILSKNAILTGAFDKYVESAGGKRGGTEVDDAFLAEIDGWRGLLATNIALRNPNLCERDLNIAVTKTIDRIVFLRICEDRGVEVYGQLQIIAKVNDIYGELLKLFRRADEKYNSGLFHFLKEADRSELPDVLTPNIDIDDKILRPILDSLYYPMCPYEFSVFPSDILGHVYEQFLGKVIRLTAGHRAKIEEKPEVRKAGGVYYTPTYVVDYIVRNTVGALLENKGPREVAKLAIVDPACGSGSFLLGAYQFLLDWHLRYYSENDPNALLRLRHPPIREAVSRGGYSAHQPFNPRNHPDTQVVYRLTTAERKRILLSNIYGVDIDQNAVETTKLSLLLKVLEGESAETLANQRKLFRERALPDLAQNIKCGNSLIARDFYENGQLSLLADETTIYKINAFDWGEQFPAIMKRHGFDAVVGNPPYVFGRDWKALGIGDDQKRYFGKKYVSSPYQLDLFSIFMERANSLCKIGGRIGQIVPNVWLTNTFSSSTRRLVFNSGSDIVLTAAPPNVFRSIIVDTVLYSLKKAPERGEIISLNRIDPSGTKTPVSQLNLADYCDGEKPISMNVRPSEGALVRKIVSNSVPLGDLCSQTRGIHPYRLGGYGTSAFGRGPQIARDLDERPYHSPVLRPGYRPFIYGKDLRRFGPLKPREYIKYGRWLAEPREPAFFRGKRIYSRKILADRLVVTIEKADSVADQQVYISVPKAGAPAAEYLAGIMGSRVIAFFIRVQYDEVTKTFPQIKIAQLRRIPIPKIDFSNPLHESRHDGLVKLVEVIVALQTLLGNAKTGHEEILRQIITTEGQMDRAVYELYDLTSDEIRLVEGPGESTPMPRCSQSE